MLFQKPVRDVYERHTLVEVSTQEHQVCLLAAALLAEPGTDAISILHLQQSSGSASVSPVLRRRATFLGQGSTVSTGFQSRFRASQSPETQTWLEPCGMQSEA